MLDLVNETAPQVERLGVEDLPPTAKKPRRPSASPTLPLSSDVPIPSPSDRDVDYARLAQANAAPAPWGEPREPLASAPFATAEILRVAALVLSARALVLVFGLCGFVIALVAALHESREVLAVLVAWCMLTVVPAIVLELRRRGD